MSHKQLIDKSKLLRYAKDNYEHYMPMVYKDGNVDLYNQGFTTALELIIRATDRGRFDVKPEANCKQCDDSGWSRTGVEYYGSEEMKPCDCPMGDTILGGLHDE